MTTNSVPLVSIVAKALRDMRPASPRDGNQWRAIVEHIMLELSLHDSGFDARAFELKAGLK